MNMYLPVNVIFIQSARLRLISLLRVEISLMSTEIDNIQECNDWDSNEKVLLSPLQLDLYC